MSRIRLLHWHPTIRISSPRSHRPSHRFFTSSSPSQPLQSRPLFRWTYLWYASILALGITTGLSARHFAAPLGLPLPGSSEDALILQSLGRDIDNLDVVQTLRKQSFNLHKNTSLSPDRSVGGSRKIWGKGWVELDLNAVSSQRDAEERSRGGMLRAISGTRGLGVQRAFWNDETREMVAVVWMGGGLAGWPGVAHGGGIATVFEEVMARMIRGPVGDVEQQHRPTSISLTYAKPTYTLDFYVLRASFSQPDTALDEPPPQSEVQPTPGWLGWLSPQKDKTRMVDERPRQIAEIIGTLENMKGDLCVKVTGTFG